MVDRTPKSDFRELEEILEQANQLGQRFADAWKEEEPPRIEHFLPPRESSEYEFLLLSLIEMERQILAQRGRVCRLDEWLARFPDSGELIREHWPMFSAKSPGNDDGSSSSLRRVEARAINPMRTLGGRRLLEQIGEGKSSLVYRCCAAENEPDSIFKVLRKDFLSHFPESDQLLWLAQWETVHREIQSRSPLGLVTILEVGHEGEQYFLRLEKCQNGLLDRVTTRSADPTAMARIIDSATAALETAHVQGLFHGALGPSNLLMNSMRAMKISGLGFVQSFLSRPNSWKIATRGMRNYLAPELIANCECLAPACDIFSLGAILYSQLSGRPPHGNLEQTAEPFSFPISRPIPLRRLNPAVSKSLERLVSRCLELNPSKRPRNLGAFRDELSVAMNGKQISQRGAWPHWQFWNWFSQSGRTNGEA